MARSKKACIVFFDEVDAIGGARFDDGVGGDNEVQRTMLEIVNQLDGFDARGNIKVLMATNRLVDFTTIWFFCCSLFYCRCYYGSVSHSQYSLLFFLSLMLHSKVFFPLVMSGPILL